MDHDRRYSTTLPLFGFLADQPWTSISGNGRGWSSDDSDRDPYVVIPCNWAAWSHANMTTHPRRESLKECVNHSDFFVNEIMVAPRRLVMLVQWWFDLPGSLTLWKVMAEAAFKLTMNWSMMAPPNMASWPIVFVVIGLEKTAVIQQWNGTQSACLLMRWKGICWYNSETSILKNNEGEILLKDSCILRCLSDGNLLPASVCTGHKSENENSVWLNTKQPNNSNAAYRRKGKRTKTVHTLTVICSWLRSLPGTRVRTAKFKWLETCPNYLLNLT